MWSVVTFQGHTVAVAFGEEAECRTHTKKISRLSDPCNGQDLGLLFPGAVPDPGGWPPSAWLAQADDLV